MPLTRENETLGMVDDWKGWDRRLGVAGRARSGEYGREGRREEGGLPASVQMEERWVWFVEWCAEMVLDEPELAPDSDRSESRRWYNAGVVVVNPAGMGAAKDARTWPWCRTSTVRRPKSWAAGSEPRRARREGGMAIGRALGGNMRLGLRC